MLSFTQRLLIASGVVLVTFLGFTGLALDRAFRDSALVAVQERLQAHVDMLLVAADLDDDENLLMPADLPEGRFSTPGSGLYAGVVDMHDNLIWRSPSTLGIEIPFAAVPDPGVTFFNRINPTLVQPLFALVFTVNWQMPSGGTNRYTFWVVESQQAYDDQVGSFQRGLWLWLLAPLLVLPALQGVILRWSLTPLREVAREVREIETGKSAELTGSYPRELRPLTENLNGLIRHSRSHLERYRNALGDLAHSLKTPLAVLRGAVESDISQSALQHTLEEQLTRMNQTVDYQLQRAAASGRIALTAPIEIQSVVTKIVDSLAKVYADKRLAFRLQIDADSVFFGDEGDLMEILGNLLDNACKWARHRVELRVRNHLQSDGASGLIMEVEDDGPGIPSAKARILLNRGQRADPDTAGQGIGLAVVRELVEDIYHGDLEITAAATSGALVRITLAA